jgi:hypothetical protein
VACSTWAHCRYCFMTACPDMLCPLCDGVDPTPQILMACVAKFVPSILVSKIVTRKSWGFCASLGILMNTRGLVELIVLNIGLDAKILSIKMCVCSPIPCVPSCPSAAVAGPTPSHLPAITPPSRFISSSLTPIHTRACTRTSCDCSRVAY